MQHYKSHGKHCYLRSFPIKCPKCGVEVLYWECKHGCKVFFNYHPYGKLIQHRCQIGFKNKRINKYPVVIKKPLGLLIKESPSCPACGKIFKTQKDMSQHLKDSRYIDDLHMTYYNNKIELESSNNEIKKKYSPQFGKINIKKRNK